MATILVIDDDVSLLARLGSTLQEVGYEVLRASSADHGRQFLATNPDLVLLEVGIEAESGWELLAEALAQRVPVIVLTSRGREEEVVRALDAGASDVLTKPYRTNELLTRIRIRLGGKGTTTRMKQRPSETSKLPSIAKQYSINRTDRNARSNDAPSVFMSESDEQSLVNQAPLPEAPEIGVQDIESQPLGQRLRAARQGRRQSLVQANLETPSKLAIWYLQAMEEEKFSLLPRGPLAMQMVREYAQYLGLDPDRAVKDFREQHDLSPFQPLPSLGGRPEPRPVARKLGVGAGVILALVLSIGGLFLLGPNKLSAFGANVRGVFARPTATVTPTATPPPPTITPVVTLTPRPRATTTQTAPPTTPSAPTNTSAPLPTPPITTSGP